MGPHPASPLSRVCIATGKAVLAGRGHAAAAAALAAAAGRCEGGVDSDVAGALALRSHAVKSSHAVIASDQVRSQNSFVVSYGSVKLLTLIYERAAAEGAAGQDAVGRPRSAQGLSSGWLRQGEPRAPVRL